jgi:gamma-glutamyltranspeptidase
MSPTVILENDRLKMVVGGSGGPTIITATLQVILGVLAYDLPIGDAITNPRLHNQFTNETRVETKYPTDFSNSLKSKHHNVNILPKETTLASIQV